MTTESTFILKNGNDFTFNAITNRIMNEENGYDFFYNKIFLEADGKKNKEPEQRPVTIVMDGCFTSGDTYYYAEECCIADLKRHKEYADGSIATLVYDNYSIISESTYKMKDIVKVCRVPKYCNYYDDYIRDATEDQEDEEYTDFEGPRMAEGLSADDDEDEYVYLPKQEDIRDEKGNVIKDDHEIVNGDDEEKPMELTHLKTLIDEIIKNNKIKAEKFKQHPKRISHPTMTITVTGYKIDKFDECRKYFEDLFVNGNGLFSDIQFVSDHGAFHFHTIYKKPIAEEEKIIKKRKTE
jgi:hypothetical protein